MHLKASFKMLCYSAKEVTSQATLEAGRISIRAEAFRVGGNLLSSFTKMWAHQSGKRPRGSVCLEGRAEGQQTALLRRSAWCLLDKFQPSLNIRGSVFQSVQCLCVSANLIHSVNRNAVCDFLSAPGWVLVFFHSNLLFTQRLFLVIKLFK